MGWVNEALGELKQGHTVQIRPYGGSMRGRIESGQLVTLAPVHLPDVKIDDAVFVRWKGNYLLHLIKDIQEDKYLIGNNIGKINGWVSGSDIIAVVTRVEN